MTTTKFRLPVLLAGAALLATACQGNVFSLEVGSCFNDNDSVLDGGEVADVPIVECSEPHDNEVYHSFDLPDGDFPGDNAVHDAALDGCLDAFESFVGRAYEDSRYDFFPITPTRDSWQDGGDREVICALYDVDFNKLNGTARDSGE